MTSGIGGGLRRDRYQREHPDHPVRTKSTSDPSSRVVVGSRQLSTNDVIDRLQTKYQSDADAAAAERHVTPRAADYYYSDDRFVETSHRIAAHLHASWLNQQLCDVIIATSGGDLLAHKMVLAASSRSLDLTFRQGPSPDADHRMSAALIVAQIDLGEFPLEPVADSVNFAYTGRIELNSVNIGHVTACSRALSIDQLIDICRRYLIDACEPRTIFLHYSVAANNDLVEERNRLLTAIAQAFPETSK